MNHNYTPLSSTGSTIITMLIDRSWQDMDAVDLILKEFKQEYDSDNPYLLSHCMKESCFDGFKCVVNNYPEIYTAKAIISKILNTDTSDIWSELDAASNRKFLKGLRKFCLKKCENDEERASLENAIKDAWQCYSTMLSKGDQKW